MSDPFDEFQRAPAAPAADPFDEFQRATPPARTVLEAAQQFKPTAAAEAARLAARYPAPFDVAYRQLDTLRARDLVDNRDAMLAQAPELRRYLSGNLPAAAVAQEELEPLSRLEAFGRALKRGFGRTLQGLDASNVVDSAKLLDVIDRIERGELKTDADIARATPYASVFAGAGRSPESLARLREIARGNFTTNAAEYIQRGQIVDKLPASREFQEFQKSATFGEAASRIAASPVRITSEVVAESLGALAPAAPLIVGGGLAGGAPGLAAAVGLSSAGTEYVNSLPDILGKLGVDVNDMNAVRAAVRTPEFQAEARKALIKAGIVGAFDAATAGVAGARLAKGPVANIAAQMGVQAAGGGAGEAVGSVAIGEQVNPAAVLSEMIGEVPGAVIDIATTHGRRVLTEAGQRADAVAASEQLQDALRVAGSVAMREQAPDQFRALMQSVVGGNVYVDGEVLAQLPASVLQQLPETVRAEIATAAETGGTVTLPVADALAVAPGTPLEQVLIDHGRADANSMSKVEAEASGQKAAEFLRQQFESVIAQTQDQAAVRASHEAVKANLAAQITAAGRYSPVVSEQMAAWAASFYTAYGSRMGLSAEEMFQRYPLRVLGAAPVAQQGEALAQGDVSVTDQTDEATGLPLNSDGTVTVWHHTSKDRADAITKSGALKSAAEPDVYVTTRRETDTGYGDTAVAIRVKPELLQIDDEFPDGRVDYRINTGRPGGSVRVAVGEAQKPGTLTQNPTTPQTETPEFRAWFGDSKAVDADGKPLVVYHGTVSDFDSFDLDESHNGFSGIWVTSDPGYANWLVKKKKLRAGEAPNVMPLFVKAENPRVVDIEEEGRRLWEEMQDSGVEVDEPSTLLEYQAIIANSAGGSWDTAVDYYVEEAQRRGHDALILKNFDDNYGAPTTAYVLFSPEQIKSAIGNDGSFDANDPSILSQNPTAPRGTFNPQTLDLILNPNANLSTWFHEVGHFWLEVLADVASQPNAPAQIVEDMNTFLKWAGITGDEDVGGADSGAPLAQGGANLSPEARAARIADLTAQAKVLIAENKARAQAARAAGVEVMSDADLALSRANSDRVHALMTQVEELKKPPVVVKERKIPKWFGEMSDEQRAAVDSLPEYQGDGGFSLRRGGNNAEDDIYTSAESNFTDFEVVPGVRSVPLSTLGDLGGYDDTKETARISSLAERMRKDKEITPIFVGVDDSGEMYIMEGQHRARAFKALGMQSIPAKIVVDFSGGRYENTLAQEGGPTPEAPSIQPKRTPLETWNAMTLDQKRPYHERWAESVEQYVMDGKAPSAELQPLMRRFAVWLKSVYGSIKQFLAQRGVPVGQGGEGLNQAAFHGTPYRGIEKFSTDKIGTGEGAQAYGWGLYFASKREIAEHYRTALAKQTEYRGVRVNELPMAFEGDAAAAVRAVAARVAEGEDAATAITIEAKSWRNEAATYRDLAKNEAEDVRAAAESQAAEFDRTAKEIEALNPADFHKNPGQLYEVEIPEDSEMLLWDKPLSEQPEKVRKALDNAADSLYWSAVARHAGVTREAFDALPQREQDAAMDAFEDVATKRGGPGYPPQTRAGEDGEAYYRKLVEYFKSDREASQALAAAGIKGIKYLDGTSRGAGGGSYNYVIFSGDDVQITNQFYQNGPQQPGPNLQLNDDIRRVMDRMLATDEQIAQANEAAGLMPDPDSDGEAQDRLRRRSIADLKWDARVRDKALAALRKQAKGIEKDIRAEVTAEVEQMPEVRAAAALKEAEAAFENDPVAADFNAAAIADAFGYPSVEAMYRAISAFGDKAEAITGRVNQRMLEEHGDLIDDRAMREAALEAVHNAVRARHLATELRTQSEMLGARADTGQTNARGARVTINVLAEAAKKFGAAVADRTQLSDVKAAIWRHTAAERRAAKRWAEATAAGKTAEAVKAKQDQMLQHAAVGALQEAQNEARKTRDFFARVVKGNDEEVVKKGRDADIVNAARAVLKAYGVETRTTKTAEAYLAAVKANDAETAATIEPMVAAATQNAQPLDALTLGELKALSADIQAMWFLAKRSRQMEVGGKLVDREAVAGDLFARMEEIGIPDTIPGEGGAVTKAEARALMLRQGLSFLRRVEQWAEGMDGKYGGPFLRYIFQPIKDAADRYRTDRVAYRKRFQDLLNNVAPIVGDQTIEAPELGYTFGAPGSTRGTAMNEILHAILHTGNESNKRKLLLGRGWATENADGTLNTSKWDAFINRLTANGTLSQGHYDFVQGVWDLLEDTKPLAQKAHRDAFGRYFAEVTADSFTDPFGVQRRGGYVPAMVDPDLVKDNEIKKLAEDENQAMTFAFPQPAKGFTMSRVENYTRPLMLDLRSLSQHLDKVLLFSHMTGPARDVRKLLTDKKVSQPLTRMDPSVVSGMLQPWLQRSAQQVVETPIVGAGKWARVPSIIRARAGAALMFANVSNAIQQVTGLVGAAVKVKPAFLMRAMAQHVAHPAKMAQAVWEASPYMDDRAKNEVAVMNEQMTEALLNPTVYEKAQNWSMKHAYFLQTALDNALSPIVWTGAYNQAMADGMAHEDAVRFADGAVRQTQGSTLPEDVSRFETGPAYARIFTQFVGYFNMLANTNGTALKQIAGEVGLKKGAGRAFSVVMLGLMVPLWIAEAIALAFKGGPDDEDQDGYLDDWLASVFGFGTAKGLLALIPIAGQAGMAAVNRLDTNPVNDRVSLSPGVSLIESALGGNAQTLIELTDESKDINDRRAVRDAATLVSIFTGLPLYAVARPAGYLAGVADDRIEPTGPVDFARGLITGTPSPESKQ